MHESSTTAFDSTVRPGLRERNALRTGVLLLALAVGGACDDPADPVPDEGPTPDDVLRRELGLRTLGPIPYPPDNPRMPERVELGRLLFFDPVLSGEGDVACATCHLPEFAFTDARQFAVGVGGEGLGPNRTAGPSAVSGEPVPPTPRNTPTVFNTAFAPGPDGQPAHDGPLFFDGRAEGLEDQALMPLAIREEMRGDALPGTDDEVVDSLVRRLRGLSAYVERFSEAFPDEAGSDFDPEAVSRSTLARALAAYQRELVTRNSPYDRWVEGDDDALTALQKEGLELFFTEARCFVCHSDPLFGSFGFFVTGVPNAGRGGEVIPGDDVGREEHTGDPADRYAFRVPSLRNVALTAPYMHSGVFGTLEEVVDFYARGARPRHPQVGDDRLAGLLREPLELDRRQKEALVAFLDALTDPGSALEPGLVEGPEIVPSGLSYRGESADFIVMASITAGARHSCAVSGRGSGVPNGTVYCWGRNDAGQLGIGTAAEDAAHVLPVRVAAPAGDGELGSDADEIQFFRLAAGRSYTCGRSIHEQLYCWGGGVVGGGSLRPARVGDGAAWDLLDGGEAHVCAIDADGRLFCWGENGHGQLGTGTTADAVGPVRVPGGPWQAVSAGARHTCALTADGQLLCWGDNRAGQLGIGSGAERVTVPTAVAGDAPFRAVDAGVEHTCAVDGSGRAWCWGSNARGQLGRPLVVEGARSPGVVETDARFRAVAAGLAHTCAVTVDLEPWCWGDNGRGQLGLDALEPGLRPEAAPVVTERRFSELSAGLYHTCAIQSARGWCWGDNGFGQVGNGSLAPNLVPGVVVGKP